jgi:hypothetical protein
VCSCSSVASSEPAILARGSPCSDFLKKRCFLGGGGHWVEKLTPCSVQSPLGYCKLIMLLLLPSWRRLHQRMYDVCPFVAHTVAVRASSCVQLNKIVSGGHGAPGWPLFLLLFGLELLGRGIFRIPSTPKYKILPPTLP